ncbi:MAG: UPF0182 family protein, partial [Oscillospiraceae bacterium]|nr:UPF0182 family protein [Oscillospiraceae bacterium]
LDKQIPEDIVRQIVYPKYLFNIQAGMLKRYHNVRAEVLYRADDVWDVAKERGQLAARGALGTDINSYYTTIRSSDGGIDLALIIPYTVANRQNLRGYLVGTHDAQNGLRLRLHTFGAEQTILGTMQLWSLIEQNETIYRELNRLNVAGTRLEKHVIVVPVNNALLYVKPVYQVMLNESQVPILRRVIVASRKQNSNG